jgi:hypothetical protein
MKTLKIVLALAAVIGLVTITVGLSFAHYNGTTFDYMHDYVQDGVDEDWWVEMREHMEARWSGIEDEAWFDDMLEHMEEHEAEIQNQEWYNEMIDYMEDQGHSDLHDHDYDGHMGFSHRGFVC